jgi:hypothetical protein
MQQLQNPIEVFQILILILMIILALKLEQNNKKVNTLNTKVDQFH